MAFTGNGTGGQSTSRQNNPDGVYQGTWSDLGAVQIGQPATGVDRKGCVYSFAMTDAGTLTVRDQATCTGDAPLSRSRDIE
ncbi:hypothetical protein CLV40_11337 [Actinokineospora auranticolor]|uniref:Uncharacterized protein n=2 Tax=Actinokineospora auranticolor TaxID=155976 RepID=A0A2S6GK23_9PSEU|nr:hypothetical protein CLV40_11337 [Actinokineospora auranticolor]